MCTQSRVISRIRSIILDGQNESNGFVTYTPSADAASHVRPGPLYVKVQRTGQITLLGVNKTFVHRWRQQRLPGECHVCSSTCANFCNRILDSTAAATTRKLHSRKVGLYNVSFALSVVPLGNMRLD